jgi:hypothetical protein
MTPEPVCSPRSAQAEIGPLDRGVGELHGLSQFDLAPARALLGETELIGVVPAAERDQLLLGLRGITARAGREANAILS